MTKMESLVITEIHYIPDSFQDQHLLESFSYGWSYRQELQRVRLWKNTSTSLSPRISSQTTVLPATEISKARGQ